MSKTETELPARLRDSGATELERRLLSAASREEPSRALSERMAGALGVAMPAAESGLGEATNVGTAAPPKAAAASSSLVPWAAGVVLAALVAGGFFAARPSTPPASPAPPAAASSRMSAPVTPPAVLEPSAGDIIPKVQEATRSMPPASAVPRGRSSDVADQIALIDAARSALTAGGAERALTTLREYQARYPKGAFRPEADAIKIEALLKLGRTDEARASARRFLGKHGPSPLADRVARLAGPERL